MTTERRRPRVGDIVMATPLGMPNGVEALVLGLRDRSVLIGSYSPAIDSGEHPWVQGWQYEGRVEVRNDLLPLRIELVPSTAWWSNVRSNVRPSEWNICKQLVRERSGSRCEVCGGRGNRWPVECHEVWDYEFDWSAGSSACSQVLVGLVALCPPCHSVKHMGFTESRGQGRSALQHLAKVNSMSMREAQRYRDLAFALWEVRSSFLEWRLDVSYLSLLGIDVPETLDRQRGTFQM